MRSYDKERASERMVGLDIGEHGASASLLGFAGKGGLSLKAAGMVEYDEKATEKEIAAAIKKLWKQAGFGSYTVCAGMHPESLLWKAFSYPDLNEEDLKAALHLDAEEDMQLSSDELVMDVHIYSKDGDKWEGFYVAIRRSERDRLLRILDMARLFAVIVDVSLLGAANLFIRSCQAVLQEKTVCLVCLDGHHADILVLEADRLNYARSVAAHSASTHQTASYISESIREVIEHSQINDDTRPVGSVLFSGASVELEETVKTCQDLTGLPVEIWYPLDGVKLTRHARHSCKDLVRGGGRLVTSMGMALRRAL